MLDLDAPPLELGAGQQELLAPGLGRLLDAVEDGFLVDEEDGVSWAGSISPAWISFKVRSARHRLSFPPENDI